MSSQCVFRVVFQAVHIKPLSHQGCDLSDC